MTDTLTAPAPTLHNAPPHLQAYEAHKANIEDLYTEAGNWCDGAEIENDAQASEVERLVDLLREAHDGADASRAAEKAPLDEQVAEIQARYNVLIGNLKNAKGLTVRAKEACLAALTAWRNKKEAGRRAEAERLRQEAADKAAAAAEAIRAASGSSDLAAREDAEALLRDSQATARAANRVESAPKGMRTTWVPALVNPTEALKHYAAARPDDIKACLLRLAQEDVRAGKRHVPGFTITEERKAF